LVGFEKSESENPTLPKLQMENISALEKQVEEDHGMRGT
jgi:hypothetical protein